jgi:predicted phage terminase large subunit-like protein
MRASPSAMYSEILTQDYYAFLHRCFVELHGGIPFIPNWHLEVLAAKLEDVRFGRCRRLIINVPPRFLKSIVTTVAFPAWLMGHDPFKKILCVSHTQDVSDMFARKSRALIQSPFYQALFDTRLSQDRHAVGDFETTMGGSRYSTSVDGVVTSRGADVIIIDDPLKAAEAISDARRSFVNEWYDNTLRSRLDYQKTGAIIIVMQRLHADDLVAHVQEREHWDVLSFPAMAVETVRYNIRTPYGRRRITYRKGDLLQPALLPTRELENLRRGLGEYNFTAQYQQNPTPREGNMVKVDWLKYYEPGSEPAKFDYVFQSWDTANKASELSNFSVCTTWGVKDGKFWLLDVFRKRVNYPDLKRAVVEVSKRYHVAAVLIEDKVSGMQLIQELSRDSGVPVRAHSPNSRGDKVMRLHAQTGYFENGRVFLPSSAPWLPDYVGELTAFPNSRFDDQVDSTSQFFEWYCDEGSTWEPPHSIVLQLMTREEPWLPDFTNRGP